MGAFGANGAEVRGGACGIPAAGHKGKFKAVEGRVVDAVDGKNIPPGIQNTVTLGICVQETGDGGVVGGHKDDFRRFYKRDGL